MKSNIFKQVAFSLAFLLVVSVFTSCNRNGYGCPYELKAPTTTIIKCMIK